MHMWCHQAIEWLFFPNYAVSISIALYLCFVSHQWSETFLFSIVWHTSFISYVSEKHSILVFIWTYWMALRMTFSESYLLIIRRASLFSYHDICWVCNLVILLSEMYLNSGSCLQALGLLLLQCPIICTVHILWTTVNKLHLDLLFLLEDLWWHSLLLPRY